MKLLRQVLFLITLLALLSLINDGGPRVLPYNWAWLLVSVATLVVAGIVLVLTHPVTIRRRHRNIIRRHLKRIDPFDTLAPGTGPVYARKDGNQIW